MLEIGQIVFSKCGRDKGRAFVVISSDSEFAYLSDGDLRKLDKPKKKKQKHIQMTKMVSIELQSKLNDKAYLVDADLRKVLSKYTAKPCDGCKEEVIHLV